MRAGILEPTVEIQEIPDRVFQKWLLHQISKQVENYFKTFEIGGKFDFSRDI
jgi:hypothetical protein